MVDRGELIRRAAELVPALRERAVQTEELRRIPQETVDALRATEAMRAAQPVRYGGLGLTVDAIFDVAAELGRGCGSTAWCYSVWASHNWLAGMFPEQAQEEYWAESYDTLSSTSFNPSRGQVADATGGYRLSGRWDFSSGCDAATWVLLNGIASDGLRMFMLPRTDYAIDDNWFVSGLRGTGSKEIVVDDIFVPEYRSVLVEDMSEARSPGRALDDSPNFRIPQRSMLTFALTSPVLGMAQGALEAFEAQMSTRVSSREGSQLAEMPHIQSRLGESAAEVWAARLIMEHDCRELLELAQRDEMPTLEQRVRYRRDQGYMAKILVQAVNRLFEVAGGRGIYDSSDLQRFHRDIHAATHHVGLTWDPKIQLYGQLRLGVAPDRMDV